MSDTLLVLAGPAALSRFRLEKLLAGARGLAPALAMVYAEWLHFVVSRRSLTKHERGMVDRLLDYGPRTGLAPRVGAPVFTVVPRTGTVSPWSSKATDIFAICGMQDVIRVERGVRWYVSTREPEPLPVDGLANLGRVIAPLVHDRMTQSVLFADTFESLFSPAAPRPLGVIALGRDAIGALENANRSLGLALSEDEVQYLADAYRALGRDPTDVELMMFAQANSEHCRHKIFNAEWIIDGKRSSTSLFEMIKETHRRINGVGILSAYTDNAAVIEGYAGERLIAGADDHRYRYVREPTHILMKVETHNHPTAIAPYPGAATGSGGEIRDEGAVGRGSKPKAGLTGFTTSHLEIPGDPQPWELSTGRPPRIVSALDIMLEGPIGAAAFNNEFGRPALTGYFRTFELLPDPGNPDDVRGYHKPVMLAGGVGNIRPMHVRPQPFGEGAKLVVLGGPAMLIGLGGGAASSMASGVSSSDLDFASVQRDNAEMQRRCQEVIDACVALGDHNPIRQVHDVGAGGLSNALPELVKGAGTGGAFQLRDIPSADSGLSPLEIWCNEAQERYVLAIGAEDLGTFDAICRRERCPYAVVGESTREPRLVVVDDRATERPAVDLPLAVLFGKPPRLTKSFGRAVVKTMPFNVPNVTLAQALDRVLRLPAVGSKRFLVTIGDRSITGCVVRDQMVGPWQVPVADAAVTAAGYRTYAGEAMAIGERPPLALVDSPAAARMAVGEALTNLASVRVEALSRVVLSANWMAASGIEAEDQALHDAVRAVGLELCPALGIAIPVGKDSLSMRTTWRDGERSKAVTAPMTLNVTAFAPVPDVRKHTTPQLRLDLGPTRLLLIDLGAGRHRLGASAFAQSFGALGNDAPDVDDPKRLVAYFDAMQGLIAEGLVLAYHDRSDGGAIVTLLEMAFAGRCGLEVDLEGYSPDGGLALLRALFAEELGGVLQVRTADLESVKARFAAAGLGDHVFELGAPTANDRVLVLHRGAVVLDVPRHGLERRWAETSYRLQALRDNPGCAVQEHSLIDEADRGMSVSLSFSPAEDVAAPYVARGRPSVAVLREQGVNGQLEMAAAFERAGFDPVDVHMSDLLSGQVSLADFPVLAACGGFSYGDVLGGGGGWAKSVLYSERARDAFATFFARDTLSLGICNGCQMFAQLKELIPGAQDWPRFVRNLSEQFEGRTTLVRIANGNSPWLAGMAGSVIPVAVAHGEGRVELDAGASLDALVARGAVAVQFVDSAHRPTERYPFNPNGATRGIAGLTSADGRSLIMMPHPERVFRTVANSWHPDEWSGDGPWLRLFRNARVALG